MVLKQSDTCGKYTIPKKITYKLNVSLYLGDQLFDLDLVACFRFLSDRWGPIRFTSTKGLNIPETRFHFKSLAATTKKIKQFLQVLNLIELTFDGNFVLSSSRMSEQIHLNGNFSNATFLSVYGIWKLDKFTNLTQVSFY